MTTSSAPTQRTRNSSNGWIKKVTVACVMLAGPAVIALGVAGSAHADTNLGNVAASHSAESVAVPTTHKAFPGQANGHSDAVSGAFRGQHGAVVHHRHRGGRGADAGDSGE